MSEDLFDIGVSGAKTSVKPRHHHKRTSLHATSSGMSSLPFDDITRITSPDELLSTFRTPASMAAHVLHRLSANSERTMFLIRQEMDDAESCAEDVGIATERLCDACNEYVRRYQTRMDMLQRYSAEASTSWQTGYSVSSSRSPSWAVRIQDFYQRPFSTRYGKCVFAAHTLIIVATLISLTLQTVPWMNPRLHQDMQSVWIPIESVISVLYLVDIMVLFLANLFDPHRAVSESVFVYFTSLANCFDIAALVLPTVQVMSGSNTFADAFILFRLMRMYRLMRSLRHFYAFEDLFETLSRSAFPLIGPVIAVIIFVVAFASLVYTMEAGSYDPRTMRFMTRSEDCEVKPNFVLGLTSCPRQESQFLSIFHTMWFSLIALLTVGYGDLVPLTMSGRAISLICIVLGQLLMAMPIAIIGNKFTGVVASLKSERRAVLQYMTERHVHVSEDEIDLLCQDDALGTSVMKVGASDSSTTTLKRVPSVGDGGGSINDEDAMSKMDEEMAQVGGKHNSSGFEAQDAARREEDAGSSQSSLELPSVMFCRFLQYALKQRTLSFGEGSDRLVAYATEAFLRNAATKYLAHVESMFREVANSSEVPMGSSTGSVPPPQAAHATADHIDGGGATLPPPAAIRIAAGAADDDDVRGEGVGCTLSLIHPDIQWSASLPSHRVVSVGVDTCNDVVLRSATVRGAALALYNSRNNAALKQLRLRLENTAMGDESSRSSSLVCTSTQVSLRRAYALSPLHCVLAVETGAMLEPDVFVRRIAHNVLTMNNQLMPISGEAPVHNEEDLVRFSLVDHSPALLVNRRYRYQ